MNDYDYDALSALTDELESYIESYDYNYLSETGDVYTFGGYKFIIANSVSAFLFAVFGIFIGLYFEGENFVIASVQMCHFQTLARHSTTRIVRRSVHWLVHPLVCQTLLFWGSDSEGDNVLQNTGGILFIGS